jgi:hypothetical protein
MPQTRNKRLEKKTKEYETTDGQKIKKPIAREAES